MLFYLYKGVTSYVTSPPGREVRSKLREVLGKSSLIIFTCTIKLEVNIFIKKKEGTRANSRRSSNYIPIL